MRHFSLTAVCAATLAAPLAAQRSPISLDASVGGKGGAQRAALSAWNPVVQLAARLHLGLGARVSAYGGDPIGYTYRGTVQGSLTPSVTIDAAVYALNAAVFGALGLIDPVALGANLDLVGVAAGRNGPPRAERRPGSAPQDLQSQGDQRLRIIARRIRSRIRLYDPTRDGYTGGVWSSTKQSEVERVAKHCARQPSILKHHADKY